MGLVPGESNDPRSGLDPGTGVGGGAGLGAVAGGRAGRAVGARVAESDAQDAAAALSSGLTKVRDAAIATEDVLADAAKAVELVGDTFAAQVTQAVAATEEMNLGQRILAEADRLGVNLSNRESLERRLMELERARGLLQLELAFQQISLSQELLGLSDAALASWRSAIDEISAADPGQGGRRAGAGGGRRRARREEAQREADRLAEELAELERRAAGPVGPITEALEELGAAMNLFAEGTERDAMATGFGLTIFSRALGDLVDQIRSIEGGAALLDEIASALSDPTLSPEARASLEESAQSVRETLAGFLAESLAGAGGAAGDLAAGGEVDALRQLRRDLIDQWEALPEDARPSWEEFREQLREQLGGSIREASEVFAGLEIADVAALSASSAMQRFEAFGDQIREAQKAIDDGLLSSRKRTALQRDLDKAIAEGLVVLRGEGAAGFLATIDQWQTRTGQALLDAEELAEFDRIAFELERQQKLQEIELLVALGVATEEQAERWRDLVRSAEPIAEISEQLVSTPASTGTTGDAFGDFLRDLEAWERAIEGAGNALKEQALAVEAQGDEFRRRLEQLILGGLQGGDQFFDVIDDLAERAREAFGRQLAQGLLPDDPSLAGQLADRQKQIRDTFEALAALDFEDQATETAILGDAIAAATQNIAEFLDAAVSGLDPLREGLEQILGLSPEAQGKDLRSLEARAIELLAQGDLGALEQLTGGTFQADLLAAIERERGLGVESQAVAADLLARIELLRESLGDQVGADIPELSPEAESLQELEGLLASIPTDAETQIGLQETMVQRLGSIDDQIAGNFSTAEANEEGLDAIAQQLVRNETGLENLRAEIQESRRLAENRHGEMLAAIREGFGNLAEEMRRANA
jgi:hypothetical protein